ncbi:uncharacterized protein LOC115671829 [Syzygium oleosum]|uniref:uncharacterized protein LOC115671829 n=1 Tax=Syzygium oleosum TaxID=219896 RepID=UPI0024BA6514|nr:uncharacterized protein LOC115671829 [Syzygium oleosum]
MRMISYARVCVEIKASQPLLDSVDVILNGETWSIKVEYEWRPISCMTCGTFGHRCATPTEAPMESPKVSPIPDAAINKPSLVDGAWETVKKKRGPANPSSALVPPPPPISNAPTLSLANEAVNTFPVPEPDMSSRDSSNASSVSEANEEDSASSVGSDKEEDSSSPVPTVRLKVPLRDSVIPTQSRDAPNAHGNAPRGIDPIQGDFVAPVSAPVENPSAASNPPSTKNIRGLGVPLKHAEIRALVRAHNISCIGILETKISPTLFEKISTGLLPGWVWTANYNCSPHGRIWIGWKPHEVDLEVISLSSQVIHGHVRILALNKTCFFSVVYGEHTFIARRSLWANLIRSSEFFEAEPWLVAGDFNAIRFNSDRLGSSNTWILAFDELGHCLDQAGLDDLRYIGHRFSWATSFGVSRKQRKIDRALINDQWLSSFSFSEANFLAQGVSDHTPIIVWDSRIGGTPMYVLYQKLKLLEGRLRQLNRDSFSDISTRTSQARANLTSTQNALALDPLSMDLANLEKEHLQVFSDLRLQEESFFKQKSRIKWLKEGDMNSKYFHHFVNKRQLHNRILSVSDDDGAVLSDPRLIHSHIVSFFETLLKANSPTLRPTCAEVRAVVDRALSANQILFLSREVTDIEIRNSLFSLAKVYKCITKILANRLAFVLPSIISNSQNAFVKGRRIGDNILLAQELFAGFHHEPYRPKCAIKVDFQKAYDTVDWAFLETVLQTFGFPQLFVKLIMECVTSPKFSIAINGELHGFFASDRGIRQGDPMSPYLFTLVMEVLSGILDT